jgi:hypothetical protein
MMSPVVGLLQRPTAAAAAQPGTRSSARRARSILASSGRGLKHRDYALSPVVGQLQRPTSAAAAQPGTRSSARRVRPDSPTMDFIDDMDFQSAYFPSMKS